MRLPEDVPEERGRRRRRAGGGVARRGRRLALAARYATVNGSATWQERPAEKGGPTRSATEARLGRVPVLTFVRHLALVDADRLAAAVAVLGKGCVETTQTVGSSFSHHVPLAAELRTERETHAVHVNL